MARKTRNKRGSGNNKIVTGDKKPLLKLPQQNKSLNVVLSPTELIDKELMENTNLPPKNVTEPDATASGALADGNISSTNLLNEEDIIKSMETSFKEETLNLTLNIERSESSTKENEEEKDELINIESMEVKQQEPIKEKDEEVVKEKDELANNESMEEKQQEPIKEKDEEVVYEKDELANIEPMEEQQQEPIEIVVEEEEEEVASTSRKEITTYDDNTLDLSINRVKLLITEIETNEQINIQTLDFKEIIHKNVEKPINDFESKFGCSIEEYLSDFRSFDVWYNGEHFNSEPPLNWSSSDDNNVSDTTTTTTTTDDDHSNANDNNDGAKSIVDDTSRVASAGNTGSIRTSSSKKEGNYTSSMGKNHTTTNLSKTARIKTVPKFNIELFLKENWDSYDITYKGKRYISKSPVKSKKNTKILRTLNQVYLTDLKRPLLWETVGRKAASVIPVLERKINYFNEHKDKYFIDLTNKFIGNRRSTSPSPLSSPDVIPAEGSQLSVISPRRIMITIFYIFSAMVLTLFLNVYKYIFNRSPFQNLM